MPRYPGPILVDMTDQHTAASLRRASDEELVAALRAGSPFAINEIHARYHDALLAYARKIMGGAHHDAEEVVQDVYVKAHRALCAHPDRAISLRPWLYAIARNRALDQMRRPRVTVPLGDDALGMIAAGQDPVSLVNRRERVNSLVGHINDLPTRQRKALVMFELEDHSHSSIGRALNVTTAASKALVCRARGTLNAN
jgi:RNA polymerase sigma-70 factor, ECF subfamily